MNGIDYEMIYIFYYNIFYGMTGEAFNNTPGVKRSEREADQSPSASTKVKSAWSSVSTAVYTS
jgi:hypothetical protein